MIDPQELIDALDGITEGLAGLDPEELAELLVQLRDVIAAAQHAKRQAEAAFLSGLDPRARSYEHPVLGEFLIRKAKSRKEWDTPRVAWLVAKHGVEARRPDPDGAVEPPEHAAVAALLECARLEWRVTALRGIGIDPDAYCEVTEGAYTVQLPARDLEVGDSGEVAA